MKARLFMLALGAAIMAANGASAHHSFSMYDRHRTVTLSGTVKQYIWMAPHVTISVVSEGDRNNTRHLVGRGQLAVRARARRLERRLAQTRRQDFRRHTSA